MHTLTHPHTVLKDCNNPADQEWLCNRLRIAAHRQYNKLAFNAEQEQGVLLDGGVPKGMVWVNAYVWGYAWVYERVGIA